MPSNNPIVLLREVAGDRYLPIWIGAPEATAIAFAQQGVVPPRPLTHDLMKDLLQATGNDLIEVRITEMKDGIFYAVLVFASGVEVSARPSDSIALALRTGSKIVCAEDVLDEAGLEVPDEQEDELEKCRDFLDHVSPEAFESPCPREEWTTLNVALRVTTRRVRTADLVDRFYHSAYGEEVSSL